MGSEETGHQKIRERIGGDPHVVESDFWSPAEGGRVRCEVCPRRCRLRDGQRGLCFVRAAREGKVVLTSYGRATGLSVDPIEKKPLYHFLPGTDVLSFGTAGCNLTCRYCQNWHLSRAERTDIAADLAEPEEVARLAVSLGTPSVAFTYNDPVVFLEYAVDTAIACRAKGIRPVAVTAGYVRRAARAELLGAMDAVNIDLKAFSEDFYRRFTGGHLGTVLETIEYVHNETNAWLELTNLLIPGENDSDEAIESLVRWVVNHVGVDVPVHFSAFFPSFKMLDYPSTQPSRLSHARRIAMDHGVRYAYTGNVPDRAGSETLCHGCGALLVRRSGFRSMKLGLGRDGQCTACGTVIPGVFSAVDIPGSSLPR